MTGDLTVHEIYVPLDDRNPRALVDECEAAGVAVFGLPESAFDALSPSVTPQPGLAVVSAPSLVFDDRFVRADGPALLVLLDIADPGNVGTLIRTAEAAGVTGVLCSGGTADVLSPKVVRASAGSILRVPVAEIEATELVSALASHDISIVAAATNGRPYDEFEYDDQRLAFVLGSEAHGVRPEVMAAADHLISIPMAGAVESLNVATAGAVIAFAHASRRRGS